MNRAPLKILAALGAIVAAIVWLGPRGRVGHRAPEPSRPPAFAVKEHRNVHFEASAATLDQLSDPEIDAQLRDWLFYAVLSESGLSSDDLRKALYDLPPLRAGYVRPVAAFDFGEVRWRLIGNGNVAIALIPSDEGRRTAALAEVADAAHASLGRKPDLVRVYEYTLDSAGLTASVVRAPDIPGGALFSADYGYITSEISSVQDLASLLERTDDVSWASVTAGGLKVSGRRIEGSRTKKLRVEDLAALYQSENRLAAGLESGGGSGFSLDPVFDFKKLRQVFTSMRPELARWASENDLRNIERDLAGGGESALLDLLYKIQEASNRKGIPFERQLDEARFQRARYDGSLSGTEVGMVLFYTDLTAKLWALDYASSAPERLVRGFVPLLKTSVSPVYQREIDQFSGTRLWFGVRDSAVSKMPDAVAFSRVATRVYAASSNLLQPGKEAQPNAESAEFLGWWNDHYAQVAHFEPEYERLNQIMKWSVIFGWLSSSGRLRSLSYLDPVTVTRDNWFPDWAERNSRLRFHSWDRVHFYPKGYLGGRSEALPLLYSVPYSRPFGTSTLSGGVSLGSKYEIEAQPALDGRVEPESRRPNVIELRGGRDTVLKSSDNVETGFPHPRRGEPAVVEIKPAGRLRGEDIELKGTPFRIGFERIDRGMRAILGAGRRAIGSLSITRGPADDIGVLFSSRDVEYARAYSRTLSTASANGEHVLSALANRADVRTVIENDGAFYVEPTQAPGAWMRIAPEGGPQPQVSERADARFGAVGQDYRNSQSRWNVAFVDPKAVDAELSRSNGYLVAGAEGASREGVAFSIMTRGPPPGANVQDKFLPGGDARHILASIENSRRAKTRVRDGAKELTAGDGSYFGAFRDENTEELARRAAAHPEDQVLRAERDASLRRAEGLIASGRFEQARVELDALADILPNDPDVLMRRVVAHAASGSHITASLARRMPIAQDRLPAFLEQADSAAQRLGNDPAALRRMSAIVRGSVAKANGIDVRYIGSPSDIGIEIRLMEAARLAAGSVPSNALRYSLRRLDTNAPLAEIGVPLAPISESVVFRLSDRTVAALQPDAIAIVGTGERYWRLSNVIDAGHASGGGGTPAMSGFLKLYGPGGGRCESALNAGREHDSECASPDIYFTRPGNPGEHPPSRR